jgi:hypothetical protein
MDEPTVLDYLKSKLAFWRHSDLRIPETEPTRPEEPILQSQALQASDLPVAEAQVPSSPRFGLAESLPVYTREVAPVYENLPEPEDEIPERRGPFPWRVVLALAIALLAQRLLDPPARKELAGAILYVLSAGLTVWAVIANEFCLNPLRAEESRDQSPIRWEAFVVGGPLALLSFFLFGNLLFTPATVSAWLITLAAFCYAFWAPAASPWLKRAWSFVRQPRWRVVITPWMILIVIVAVAAIFFRVYRLAGVPPEMVSDHAEKLLDVGDVLSGKTGVFFPRNTGREFFQFYLTAAVILALKTGLSFLSLKIGTMLMGLITLPYIYLLGKEIGNKRVALFALLFAGIAYWPNVITRVALRFTLYPAFFAPMIYYMIRGLRRANRNDFILAGIALGLGLNGYSPFRIVPFVVLAGIGIYWLHRKAAQDRKQALIGLAVMTLVALVIFIPLARYTLAHPGDVIGRTLTRVSSEETPLPGPAPLIFLSNLWSASVMFFWSDGNTWVHSVVLRPALETVSAALFFLGLVLVAVRYARRRGWVDLFLLVSIPMLMLPSILSLAFPAENPSLNRTGGAIIPVFILVGIGLDEVITSLRSRLPAPGGAAAAWLVALLLVGWSAWGNYDLVFNQYAAQYRDSAWNTSEMGMIIRGFANSVGTLDSAYVVAYPYWVDTRLVGINAGYPTKDYAINTDQIPETKSDAHAKLFIVNTADSKAVDELHNVYPQGTLSTFTSAVPTKDFLLYQVPPG